MKGKYLTLILMLVISPKLIASDFIKGKVLNSSGKPEAGVWVIAQTDQLPTDYRKIVVTDDAGNYLLPELPKASYQLWVRGYGLSDSEKILAEPGETINFQVKNAKNAAEAASIYPAVYWMSMIEAPSEKAIRESSHPYPSADAWLYQFKLNCTYCHQLGSAATRLPVAELYDYSLKKAGTMNDVAKQLDRDVLLDVLGNWAKRLAAGETPAEAPPRPTGIEQNFVITQWDWGNKYTYAHDEIATDKRNPHLYPNGPIYGVDIGTDYLLELDPVTHTASETKLPAYENAKPWCEQDYKPLGGDEIVSVAAKLLGCPEEGVYTPHKGAYPNPANPHNPMMDANGRVWMTMQVRREWGEDLPEFCKKSPVIANNFHHRQIGYYDTKSKKIVQIDSCFGTHHLQFDDNEVLWFSGDGYVVGWLDTKKFDADDPASLEAAMGWSEGKIDSDGDGIADQAVVGFRYGIIPNPVDGSIWVGMPPGGLFPADGPGSIQRYDPATGKHEIYLPPAPGFGPRGVEVDSKGMIWTALAGSGHLARFDRSRCKQTWGTGDQCPEGWTLWDIPGPQFAAIKKGDNDGTADKQYYIWVDAFNTLGMGADTIIVNGTASDSLIAFRPDTQSFTVIRIPYPLVTYTRGLDGRIDDDRAGWKGRGLWYTNGLDPVYHSEIPKSYVGHIQLRPNPLAK
jgi:hypothetical protein